METAAAHNYSKVYLFKYGHLSRNAGDVAATAMDQFLVRLHLSLSVEKWLRVAVLRTGHRLIPGNSLHWKGISLG